MTLTTAFKSLTVHPADLVSPEDRKFIEDLRAEADKISENLTGWKKGLENLSKTLGDSSYKTTERNTWSTRVGHNLEIKNWFERTQFSSAYGQVYIENVLDELQQVLNGKVYDYLTETYQLYDLRLRDSALKLKDEWTVVDRMHKMLKNGGSFCDQHRVNVMTNFLNAISRTAFVHKSNKLTADRFYFSRHGLIDNPKSLSQAIHLFETGQVGYLDPDFNNLGQGEKAETTNSARKLQSVKSFLNGKLELVFRDSESAQTFLSFFQINHA